MEKQIIIRKQNGESVTISPFEKFTFTVAYINDDNTAEFKEAYYGSFLDVLNRENQEKGTINLSLKFDFFRTDLNSLVIKV